MSNSDFTSNFKDIKRAKADVGNDIDQMVYSS